MSRIINAIIWKICFIVPNENKHLYSINMDAQNWTSQSSVSDITLKLTEIPFKLKSVKYSEEEKDSSCLFSYFRIFYTIC